MTNRGLKYLGEVSTIQSGGTPSVTQVKIEGEVYHHIHLVSMIVWLILTFILLVDLSGQGGTITDYNSSTKIVTFTPINRSYHLMVIHSIGPKIVISGDGQGGANSQFFWSINGVTVVWR